MAVECRKIERTHAKISAHAEFLVDAANSSRGARRHRRMTVANGTRSIPTAKTEFGQTAGLLVEIAEPFLFTPCWA